MSSSLRDQLLKAGLVTEKQVKDAEKASQKASRKPPPKGAKAGGRKPTAAEREQAAKAARDRELNRRKAEKAEAKAREAQVRQLVDQHRLPAAEGDDDPFHFQDGKHIKRIYVTAEQRAKLTSGEIAIARYGKRFALVPRSAVERIRERDPNAIIDLDAPASSTSSADDGYEGYEVPDDLVW